MMRFTTVVRNDTMPLNAVAVIGVGLVGGSVARAAAWAGCDVTVYDHDATVRALAAADGFTVASSAVEACRGRDVVFVATPVDEIANAVLSIVEVVDPGCVITDVGSVKAPFMNLSARTSRRDVDIVLGHPVAGSHLSGFAASSRDLFGGRTWLLCHEPDAPAAGRLVALLTRLGVARVLSCDATEHDRVFARVSHVPQVLASILAAAVGSVEERAVAGTGFADMTRLASSSWDVWKPVLAMNAEPVAAMLDELNVVLIDAAASLRSGDLAALESIFTAGRPPNVASPSRFERPSPGRPAWEQIVNRYVSRAELFDVFARSDAQREG